MNPNKLKQLILERGITEEGSVYTFLPDSYQLWFLSMGRLSPFSDWASVEPYGDSPALVIPHVLGPHFNTVGIVAGHPSVLEILASAGEFEPKFPDSTIYKFDGRTYHFFLDQ